MEWQIKIIGFALIVLGMIHIAFPRYFKWKDELQALSLINRQVMMVHTFFIALTIILMGLLCITSYHDLLNTNLGKKISLGLGIFWTCRLIIQLFGYSSKLWKGKQFETMIHILFTGIWIYLSVIFLKIGLGG